MNKIIEILSCKFGEGFQVSELTAVKQVINAFHRPVTVHESSDLSFISGLVSSGLRGAALINGDKILSNFDQLSTASRQHLPLVVHTNSRLTNNGEYAPIPNYSNILPLGQTGCFLLVATSIEEDVYMTLAAHRIAELSLIPGIVIADYADDDDDADIEEKLPAENLVIQYLGSPDDQIECPTPAQKIIFGQHRRRLVNWYNLDAPVMIGSGKSGEAISFEGAASQKYFHDHLPELILQAFDELHSIFGIGIEAVSTTGQSSDYALISATNHAKEVYDTINTQHGNKRKNKNAEFITIHQLNPFPVNSLRDLLSGKKAVTVLENIPKPGASMSGFYAQVLQAVNQNKTKVYHGHYSIGLNKISLEKAILHMSSNQLKTEYFLGLDFTKSTSAYPKHNILLNEISKQYPGIEDETINDRSSIETAVSDDTPSKAENLPLSVRMYKDQGPVYSRLSRFYGETAFFYDQGDKSELVADPFTAVPVIPPASASFFSQVNKSTALPEINMQQCTGCGDCFVQCPHSALPPLAISVQELLKAGAAMTTSKGRTITKLTPMYKNIAVVASKLIGDAEVKVASDFLPQAFERLIAKMEMPADKLEIVQSEFAAVLHEVGALPVAVTEHFFTSPSAIENGSGELFSLAVDPSSCTGCSICAEVCEYGAISMVEKNEEDLSTAAMLFKLWEHLPDTPGDTISRLHHDENYSSLAALFLGRSYYLSMAGANSPEKDNPYKTLLHIITAATESVVQPKIVGQLKKIRELINELSENVHGKLSDALPKENLQGLSRILKSNRMNSRERKMTLKEIMGQFVDDTEGQSSEQLKLIDTKELQRKTDLIDGLKSLQWALSEGPTGVGRSRYGMLIAGEQSMDWTKRYPANHFTSPTVLHWNGSAPEKALGMFYGHLRYMLDNIKLMRRAVLESKDKYDPPIHDIEIAALNWDDLSEEERHLVPPVLLIAETGDLEEAGWNSLNQLLTEKYPIKVFLLDHSTVNDVSYRSGATMAYAGILSTIGLKNAFVFQGGIGNQHHLIDGLMGGLNKTYPALFNLYTAKLPKHGIDYTDWRPYASLALNSRTFPGLRYDPVEQSDFLSGSISLEGNRCKETDWVVENVAISEEETIQYTVSWADWAWTQNAWKDHFIRTDPEGQGSAHLTLTEFIKLSEQARKNHRPVIMRAGEKGLKYYLVSAQIVEMTETIQHRWRTLQEIAGLLTEFPVKLRGEIIKELDEKYKLEAETLKQHYEKLLREQEAAQTEELRKKLKEKLLALTKMAAEKEIRS